VPNAALRWRPAGAEAKPAADAPPAQAGGGQAVQQFRARLAEELKPSEAQKAQLEDIFNDARQKFARIRDVRVEADRRREMERIRAETNARIAGILTPEQRPAWERLLAESGSRGPTAAGRLWVLDNGQPKAVDVRLGLSDGSSTEIIGATLAEGAEVIVGTAAAGAAAPAAGGLPRARFF
jgi:HlyD family secretion protein